MTWPFGRPRQSRTFNATKENAVQYIKLPVPLLQALYSAIGTHPLLQILTSIQSIPVEDDVPALAPVQAPKADVPAGEQQEVHAEPEPRPG
jgi:hypothetical protein